MRLKLLILFILISPNCCNEISLIDGLLQSQLLSGVVDDVEQIGDNLIPGGSPDAQRTPCELIESRNYICDEHFLTLTDGYIISIQHIINPVLIKNAVKTIKPLILAHGLFLGAPAWLINSARGFADDWTRKGIKVNFDDDGRNLAYLLANLAYDVWVINFRGSRYSRNHTYLNPYTDNKYWRFSYQQMISYDAPESIDYVLKKTGYKKLGWIGHSMGTLIMFGLLSERKEYSDNIKPFIALAPVAHVSNITSPIRVAAFVPGLKPTLTVKGGEFDLPKPTLDLIANTICVLPVTTNICTALFALFGGEDFENFDMSRISVYVENGFLGTSVWTANHFLYNIATGRFAKYDFEKIGNLAVYNSTEPPEYKLRKINSKYIVLIDSVGDTLADPVDVMTLKNSLEVMFNMKIQLLIFFILISSNCCDELSAIDGFLQSPLLSGVVDDFIRIGDNLIPGGSPDAKVTPSIDGLLKLPSVSEVVDDISRISDNLILNVSPDEQRTPCELIESRNYICDEHFITLTDDYIISIQHIINPVLIKNAVKTIKPLILAHGFFGGATNFLINSARGFADDWTRKDVKVNFYEDGRNLAYLLANLAYDVWVVNFRGSRYSKKHVYLNPNDPASKYWRFSYQQVISYDAPETIDYVLNKTGYEKLAWIGHSMGNQVIFGLLAEQPGYSEKLSPFIALAPVAFASDITDPIRVLAFVPALKPTLTVLGGELTIPKPILDIIANTVCVAPVTIGICAALFALFGGPDFENFDRQRVPIYLANGFQGSSIWTGNHFLYNIATGRFAKYDFEKIGNLIVYNSTHPPEYELSEINLPNIVLIHSLGDPLADPHDVKRLKNSLRVPYIEYVVHSREFSHLDYIFGKNVYSEVYQQVIVFLKRFE
ncbi:uncharacterized protein LOC128397424 [Panonychus citri]|uniref:uncharacterized protein LOC128397424 n=1 Tax=Panonychus citri TaxID=50023 RepID=UPI0023081880|nr:uncharacterized protein LOC128397424 [Panonychus citri]